MFLPTYTFASSLSPYDLAAEIHTLTAKYQLSISEEKITKILDCESSFNPQARHYNKNGSIDYSYFQINSIWASFFKKKGLDIKDPQQNLEAGFYLLKTRGIKDWRYSYSCQEGKTKAPVY